MPPTKRRQSNDMLYTLIVLIGLCIVATTVAVIYYIRAEDYRTQSLELQTRVKDLASDEEIRTLGSIVGTKMSGTTQLGTVLAYLDRMVGLVKGGPVASTSAEVKVAETMKAVQPLLARVQSYIVLPVIEPNVADANAVAAAAGDPNAPMTAAAEPDAADPNAAMTAAADPNVVETAAAGPVVDPNRVALTAVINGLITKLQHTIDQNDATYQQLVVTRQQYDTAVAAMQKTKEDLMADVGQ